MPDSNMILDEGAKALAAALPRNHALSKLDLSSSLACKFVVDCGIGLEGTKALATGLVQNYALQNLCIGTIA